MKKARFSSEKLGLLYCLNFLHGPTPYFEVYGEILTVESENTLVLWISYVKGNPGGMKNGTRCVPPSNDSDTGPDAASIDHMAQW
jgi:hypothetical protein